MIYELNNYGSLLLYLLICIIPAFLIESKFKFVFKKKEIKWLKIFIIVLLPTILGMFRYDVGADYQNYLLGYRQYENMAFSHFFGNLNLFSGDPVGLFLIAKIANHFNFQQLYFGILTFLSILPVVCFLEKNIFRINKGLALSLYLMGDFFTGFNIIKQTIAIALIIYSLIYIYERKMIKFYIIIFIAFLFHSTVIIFFPMYYFINNTANISKFKKVTFICLIIFLLIYIDNILLFLGDDWYGYLSETGSSNRVFYLNIIWGALFILLTKKYIKHDKKNLLLIFIYIFGIIFQFVGFSNIFIKRIANYFLVVEFLLLAQIPFLFKTSNKNIIALFILGYKSLFFIFTYFILGQVGIFPYKFII